MGTGISSILSYYPDLRFQYDSYDHKKAVKEHNETTNEWFNTNPDCHGISKELKDKYAVKQIGRIHSITFRKHGSIYKIGNKYPKSYYETQLVVDVKPFLRSLSKLTEPIMVEGYNDGKPFVPIIELNKMRGVATDSYDELFNDGDCFGCKWGGVFSFYFEKQTLSFYDNRVYGVSPLLDMFKMLYRWHFNLELSPEQFVEIDDKQSILNLREEV